MTIRKGAGTASERRRASETLILLLFPVLVAVLPARAQDQETSAYTAEQASRGAQTFREVCANCHVSSFFATPNFKRAWSGRPALDLFEQIRSTMPQDNPGRLRRQEYADLLAYIFRLNGVRAGSTELGSDDESLRGITITPTDSRP